MKKLLLSALLFWTISVQSQIPLQLTIPKGDLADTNFVNKKISAIPKSGTGTTGGTITAPLNLTIAPGNNFLTITPSNYLQTYPSIYTVNHTRMRAYRFEMGYHAGNNGGDGSSYGAGDGMPDNVYNWSYNVDPAGNRYGLDDVGYTHNLESNYLIGNRLAIEMHDAITALNGVTTRINSYYTYKDNGQTFQNSIIDNHTYSTLTGESPYMNIHSINSGGYSGGLDFFGESTSPYAGRITFNNNLYPTSEINAGGGGINFLTGGANTRAAIDSKGNVFLNSSPDNTADIGTTFIGTAQTGDARSINSKAKLQIESTVKGVLLVRMTTTQRLAMALTATDEAMEVYDLTIHKKMVWDGSVWQACW